MQTKDLNENTECPTVYTLPKTEWSFFQAGKTFGVHWLPSEQTLPELRQFYAC